MPFGLQLVTLAFFFATIASLIAGSRAYALAFAAVVATITFIVRLSI